MTAIETGTEQLLADLTDRVLVVTLNRPEARNALSYELMGALRKVVAQYGDHPDVGALVITGAGGAFSSGGDVKRMAGPAVEQTVEEKYQAKAFIDMFVQRAAKVVGVGIGLTVKYSFVGFAGVSLLSFAVLPLVGLWSYAAVYAGRAFRQREEESRGSPP